MRKKPLRRTIRFSIEHAQARHAPPARDAFDVNSICQLIFSLKVFRYKRIQMCLTKSADKRTIQTFVEVLYIYLVCGLHIKPKFKAYLSSFVTSFNTTLQVTIRNNATINYDRKQVCKSSFKRRTPSKLNTEAHSKH